MRIPESQLQRKDIEETQAEHATGVETATNHENVQHMARNV